MFYKKLLLSTIIIFLNFTVIAQQWAPTGATWYYSVDGFGVEGYIMIEAVGDTNINGQDYRVLIKTQHTYNHISGTYFHGEIGREYTYYEDEKVFIWRNNVVYTLYDFGAQEGDEWTIPYTYEMDTICDSTGTVRCDFADTASLNGYLLNISIVNPIVGSNWSLGENAEVIQYIGNTSDYFLPNITEECPVADLFEGGTFRCYHDDILGWYTKVPVGECDFITGLVEPEMDIGVSIFPNPCSGTVFLRYLIRDSGYLISDLILISGKKIRELVHQNVSPGEYEFEIDVGNLPAGIYLLRIQVDSGVVVRKLVVAD